MSRPRSLVKSQYLTCLRDSRFGRYECRRANQQRSPRRGAVSYRVRYHIETAAISAVHT
jgi:hypothetical protein